MDDEKDFDIENNDFMVNISEEDYDAISQLKQSQTGNKYAFEEREKFSAAATNVNDYDSDIAEKRKNREHKKRNRIKAIKNKRIYKIVWIAMVLAVGFSFGNYLTIGSNDFFAVGREQGMTQVVVPENVTAKELSVILSDSGVIDAPEFFELYCTMTANMEYFKAGSYTVDMNLDYEALINDLQGGASAKIVEDILFPEGSSVVQMASILEENGVCSKGEFLEAMNSGMYEQYDMVAMITNEKDRVYKLEGYLFPSQYDFYINENIDSVVGKLLYSFQKSITKDMMEQINNSGYTLDEIITIASIIQAEAANETDMSRVSAVIFNRLERGHTNGTQALGMDSTQFYPYRVKADAPEGFTSTYETYNQKGLPHGPICNPGVAAIKAALNPDPEYASMFYFCHDKDGNAYYGKNAQEHEVNLVKAGLR